MMLERFRPSKHEKIEALLPQLAEMMVEGELTREQIKELVKNELGNGRTWRLRKRMALIGSAAVVMLSSAAYTSIAVTLFFGSHVQTGDLLGSAVITAFSAFVALCFIWCVAMFAGLPDDLTGGRHNR